MQYVKKDITIIWNDDQCAKLDIIFSSFSCNFHDNFVERGLLTLVISTEELKKIIFITEILVLQRFWLLK